jgi:DNA-binding response OmpR family regulator
MSPASALMLPPMWRGLIKLAPHSDFEEGGKPDDAESPAESRSNVGPVKILVVEDDRSLALMYQSRLQQAGYEVTVATDGWAALRQIKTGAFQLVLLDLGLPKMDGLSVLAAARAEDALKDVSVLVLSNYNEPPMIARARSLGAREYLIKTSITPTDIVAKVKQWIA